MKENIFTYDGPRGELVEIFYNLLVTGRVISYEDVLVEYDGGTLSTPNVTAHDLYKTLKHVVPEVVEALQKNGYDVLSIPNGRSTSYQYVGSDCNPLNNIRFKALLKERYDILVTCIKNKQAVNIEYQPFERKRMEIVFHPHLLHTFNGRYFAFGVSEKNGHEPFRRFNIALDRISGEIRSASSTTMYIPSKPNEYAYLANIVGVRLEEGECLTSIVIRALDCYTFGRLVTKPLHNSQKILLQPDSNLERNYGEVEITVIPNKELIGQILSYGSNVVVLRPENFKNRVSEELTKALLLYKNGSLNYEPKK